MSWRDSVGKFFTKRFVLSAAGIGLATGLCYLGKITGGDWVASFGLALAGHHAEDIVKVIRGGAAGPQP